MKQIVMVTDGKPTACFVEGVDSRRGRRAAEKLRTRAAARMPARRALQEFDGRRSVCDGGDFQGSPGLPQSRHNDQYVHAGQRLLSGRVCKADDRHDERQSLLRQPRQSLAICADRFSPSQDSTGQVVFASGFSPMRNRVLLPYLILLLGFCFTLVVYYYFYQLTYEQDQLRFKSSVQEIEDQVTLRVATSEALLRAGTGLFAASDSVDAREFQRFVEEIELDKNYEGILVLATH